jgi:hypothetical protein
MADGEIPENRRAPDGMIWECRACAKKAEDRYGIIGWHSYGYDESCALNAVPVSNPDRQSDRRRG